MYGITCGIQNDVVCFGGCDATTFVCRMLISSYAIINCTFVAIDTYVCVKRHKFW